MSTRHALRSKTNTSEAPAGTKGNATPEKSSAPSREAVKASVAAASAALGDFVAADKENDALLAFGSASGALSKRMSTGALLGLNDSGGVKKKKKKKKVTRE